MSHRETAMTCLESTNIRLHYVVNNVVSRDSCLSQQNCKQGWSTKSFSVENRAGVLVKVWRFFSWKLLSMRYIWDPLSFLKGAVYLAHAYVCAMFCAIFFLHSIEYLQRAHKCTVI